jgi:hypothetical protein
MTAILPIDEIIENGIVFNLFSEAFIRGTA